MFAKVSKILVKKVHIFCYSFQIFAICALVAAVQAGLLAGHASSYTNTQSVAHSIPIAINDHHHTVDYYVKKVFKGLTTFNLFLLLRLIRNTNTNTALKTTTLVTSNPTKRNATEMS